MSPVMIVVMKTPDGSTLQEAILKLFDRRFGEPRERCPYNSEAENAWKDCVRSGLADKVIGQLQYDDDQIKRHRLESTYKCSSHSGGSDGGSDRSNDTDDDDDDEDENEEVDEAQKNEAIIFYKNQEFYTNEVRAYTELQSLQGKHLPRFLEAVIDDSPDRPADLPATFFQVRGILLEYITSFTLFDMISLLPHQPRLWTQIVEDAIRMVIEINKAGVVHHDCQPRNVLVRPHPNGTYQPYLIDFSQCGFRADWRDTTNWRDDRGWAYKLGASDNAGAIAVLMQNRVARETPYKLEIDKSLYMDCYD